MGLRVRIEHGQDAGKTWRLPGPGAYRFGRTPQASIQILDMKVSKDHFEIVVPNGAAVGGANGPATIRDLGSSHGTLLNAQKVGGDARALSPGDEIRLGLTVLRVLSDGPGDAEAKPTGPPPVASGAAGGGATTSTSSAGLSNGGSAAARPAGKPAEAGTRTLPPDALVGTTLAGYKIIEKVGAGGMGAVYRAEQLSLHREVALKVLAEKLVSDSAFVDQFVNEARAAGQLNHPNVVQVYDVGHADGRHFFSMEFIHGGPLEGRIQKGAKGGVPWQDALGWFLDAANALIFAEKKGILHRDIKPDNFMLSQDGSVKLCDLGLAKKSESADLLAQGIIGTPHFISPEAIRRRNDVDKRSDLYSLGCTYFRLLTGKNPYPAASVKEILLAHLNAPVPRVSATVADLPKELDEVVFKLMQKDPAARFQGADELWAALDKIRLQFGLEAHGIHPGRAKRVAILAAVGGVIAIGVAVYFVFIKEPETRDRPIYVPQDRPTGVDPNELRVANARGELLEIESAANKLGDLDKSYPLAGWDDIVRRYGELASHPDSTGTPSAEEAEKRAKSIREKRDGLLKRDREVAEARAKVAEEFESHLKKVVSDVARLRGDAKLFDADKAAKDGLARVGEFEKRAEHGVRLLSDEAIEEGRKRLSGERDTLTSALRDDFEAAEKTAAGLVKPGTAAALEEALLHWKTWREAHPVPEGAEGPLAVALQGYVTKVKASVSALQTKKDDAIHADLRADRRVYHSLLQALFLDKSEASVGGLYARFRFAEAVAAVTKARAEAKTPAYRKAIDGLLDQANRLAAFADGLKRSFQGALPKETFVGTGGGGWKGVIKGVDGEAVLVDGKQRPFAEESLAFLLDLFYDAKEKERIPLDADAHEALALVATIGVVTEGASFLPRVEAEAKRAGEADASRAARLDALRAWASAEATARGLWDESWKEISGVEAEIARILAKIETVDEKTSKAGRAEAIEKEAELRARLKKAREDLVALGERHASSVVLAAHVEEVPAKASWAGETPPPAPAKRQPPGPEAPPSTPGPGMGEPAMKDEAGAMNDGGGATDEPAMGEPK